MENVLQDFLMINISIQSVYSLFLKVWTPKTIKKNCHHSSFNLVILQTEQHYKNSCQQNTSELDIHNKDPNNNQ